MEFYYHKSGQRIGPIDTAKLKELVQQRIIVPDVPVECEGKIYPARKVKGLEFPQDPPELPPVHHTDSLAEKTDKPTEQEQTTTTSGNSDRIIFIQQPTPQHSAASNQVPSPYPVRVVREPRSYIQRQRADRLERASNRIYVIGWIYFIGGILSIILGLSLIFVAVCIDADPEACLGIAGTGAFFIFTGIVGMIPTQFIFFVAAFGRFMSGEN